MPQRLRTALALLLLLPVVLPLAAAAQPAARVAATTAVDEELPVYYAVARGATVYSEPDGERPYVRLRLRETVYALGGHDGWLRVRTRDGAHGWVREGEVSNVWIRVSKQKQTVWVYRGTELVASFPADLGHNFFTDKEQRGSRDNPDHWRTPEGSFFVVRKNDRSKYYKALVINYPTAEDAERGRRQGLISESEYAAITRAEAEVSMPPMSTALGGWIEIHGKGTGLRSNWTQGCVAVTDGAMDRLWQWVHVGTPVLIEQ